MLRLICLSLLVMAAIAMAYDDEINLQVSVIEPSENQFDDSNDELQSVQEDLCANTKCKDGYRCVVSETDDTRVAECVCIDHCEVPRDERQRICTKLNRTYDSDCEFYRQKCVCEKNKDKCPDQSIQSDSLEYYGACKNIDQCTEEQKKVFPGRMKIWLDEVLHILGERKDLEPKFYNLVKLADEMKANHVEKYWTCGVAFEFCQLDKSKDSKIQIDELKALISSIKALESCIQPFLEECDADRNNVISDVEWAKCLDLSESDMDMLKKYCDYKN